MAKSYIKSRPKLPEPTFKVDLKALGTAEIFGLWLSALFLFAVVGFLAIPKSKKKTGVVDEQPNYKAALLSEEGLH
jgi:hypothetical protein